MAAETRVVIADSDAQSRKCLKAILNQAGHVVVGEADDGLEALKLVRTRQPDLVILDAKMVVMDVSDFAYIIEDDGLAPVVLMTQGEHHTINELVAEGYSFAYIIKPVTEKSLLPIIDIVLKDFRKIRYLEQEVDKLKNLIETRKLVDKAKGILMDSLKLSEAEAFKRIQKQSMNKRVSMKSVAKAIILAHEV